jgi:hypothetical protein
MGLGVRAEVFADPPRVLGHALEVALEAIEVEQQGGRGDLVARGGRHLRP